jgi:hypothetical protein
LASELGSIIERLSYLNLEASSGKVINTKDNINIRCRINPLEEHTWHTSHSQLNIVVDLIYNFLITWEKRQDNLEQKLEIFIKNNQKLVERCSALNNKFDLILHKLEEAKGKQNIVCKNNDYIKEEVINTSRNLGNLLNKISVNKESLLGTESRQDILEVKKLIQEVKKLIIS